VASYRFVFADVFTSSALAGNQLAVFTDARELPEELLQPLAKEIGFSETVYVYPAGNDAHARIRIFTPATELPFAGHPVLGTAFVLGAPLQLGEIRLETGVGVVPVVLEREGARIIFGWMRQPVPEWGAFTQADELLELLGVRSSLRLELYRNGPEYVYVELGSAEEVARVAPDFGRLGELTPVGVNCFAGSGSN
jgi:trans-2,3-dihydro-3-hydroxyanthranilate isomerase